MMRSRFLIGLSLLLLVATSPAALRGTKPDRLPRGNEPAKPGVEAPPPMPRQRIFGIGVGFETTGALAGVALRIVLPGSPAARAGLATGFVVSEINGESTAGRSGEDCARIIREGGNTVKLKYRDAAMREHTITLDKQWILVPE